VECEFETSPITFLSVVLKGIRRDGARIERTHMGRILAGEVLTHRDFPDEEGEMISEEDLMSDDDAMDI